jgi:hypothetical protein
MRRLWFWLPLLLWLAVEIYLLQGAMSVSCDPQPGGNRREVFIVLFLWGLPSSVLVTLVAGIFFDSCSTGGCIGVWLLYCSIGLIQWYFALRGLEWVATKLYQRLRSIGTGATG